MVIDKVTIPFMGKAIRWITMKYECALCHDGITEEGMSYCEECWEYWLIEQKYWKELEEEEDEQ